MSTYCSDPANAFKATGTSGAYKIYGPCGDYASNPITSSNPVNAISAFTSACQTAYANYSGKKFFTDYPDCGCFMPDQANNYMNQVTKLYTQNGLPVPAVSALCQFPACLQSAVPLHQIDHCPSTVSCIQVNNLGNDGTINGAQNINNAITCGGGAAVSAKFLE